jgi:tRNA (cmo5U34)-methyltransferase
VEDPGRDKLFGLDVVDEDFVFNERVVEVFDDMLDRSIPYYRDVIRDSAKLLRRHLETGDTIYDLGSANGTSLLEFATQLDDLDVAFIGIDNCPAMLAKARLKAELFSKEEHVSFVEEDILEFHAPGCGAVILNYTLQFIRPLRRQAFLKNVFRSLRPGGLILISEKIILRDQRLNRDFIKIYHDFKKARGYSELEIAKKREALENILIPFSLEENCDLLNQCGFSPVVPYFQWFNFVSLAAVKPLP